MDVEKAYSVWSEQYDTNANKTRDLEAKALRETLSKLTFKTCLELGCGTGKNTEWLISKAEHVTAIDLSEEMLAKAKQKINPARVQFIQADITQPWTFVNANYELVSFSLVLEHVENLDFIFSEVSKVVSPGGHVYIGELHPFKQYAGTKARFETEEGLQIVACYNHNLTDFIHGAKQHGLDLVTINEYFDDCDRTTIPRILALLFRIR